MKNNKKYKIIIFILILFIFINVFFGLNLFLIIKTNNLISITIDDKTNEVFEVNNDNVVPNNIYKYNININSIVTDDFIIEIDLINENKSELENFLNIEIIFMNNILYKGSLNELVDKTILYNHNFVKDKTYELQIIYYLDNNTSNNTQTNKSNFDVLVSVKKEGGYYEKSN